MVERGRNRPAAPAARARWEMSTPFRRAAAIARRSGGSPRCQSPVPALSTSTSSPSRPASAPEGRLGQRRAADIAEADEQDTSPSFGLSLVAKAPRSASQERNRSTIEGSRCPKTVEEAPPPARPRIGAYAWYALFRPRPRLHRQFHRPADPLDPGRRHQARPRRLATPRSAFSTAPPSPSSTLCSASRSGASPTAGIAAG